MHLQIPFMIGFGIQTREDFLKAGQWAQGAIIGSRFIKLISEISSSASVDIENRIAKFVCKLKNSEQS